MPSDILRNAQNGSHPFAMKCHRLLGYFVFAFGYVVLAAISMRQRDAVTLSTLFWPPTGLLMAVLMLNPPWRWGGWMALAAALHTAAGMLAGERSPTIAMVFALADLAFCGSVAALWRWRTLQANTLTTLPAALWFVILLAAGSIVGGVLATLGVLAIEPATSAEHWYVWSLAAFVGCMIVTPLVLTWARFRWHLLAEQSLLQLWIGLIAAFALLAGTTIMFNDPPHVGHFVWHDGFGMSYGPLFFLMIVALCWGAAGSTLTVVGLALITSSYTMSGMGPYANSTHFNGEPLLAMQGYLGCAALLSLLTTALAADRERALQRTSTLTFQLEAALRVSEQAAWEFRRADQHLLWLGELPYGIVSVPTLMPLDDWLTRVHPEDRDRLRAWLYTGTDFYAERRVRFQVIDPNGTYQVMEMIGSAREDTPDKMAGLLGVPRDEIAF
jgi:integral membrane sensor domain MASE1